MEPVLKCVDKWNGARRYEVLRPIGVDDFDITEYADIPEDYVGAEGEERAYISCRYIIKLKQEVFNHLVHVLKVKMRSSTNRSGKTMFADRCDLDPYCFEWVAETSNHYLQSREEMSYKGIRKNNIKRRQERYSQIKLIVENDWRERKQEMLEDKVDELWEEFLQQRVLRANALFLAALQDTVGNLQVKESWLKKNRPDRGKEITKRIAKVDKKREALRQERLDLSLELCDIDRDVVCDYFLHNEDSKLSDDAKSAVQKIVEEERGKLAPSRDRRRIPL